MTDFHLGVIVGAVSTALLILCVTLGVLWLDKVGA